MIHKPSLILADEPTGNLHSSQAREIMELFTKLNQVGGGPTRGRLTSECRAVRRYRPFPNVASIRTHRFGSRRTSSGSDGTSIVNAFVLALTCTLWMAGTGWPLW